MVRRSKKLQIPKEKITTSTGGHGVNYPKLTSSEEEQGWKLKLGKREYKQTKKAKQGHERAEQEKKVEILEKTVTPLIPEKTATPLIPEKTATPLIPEKTVTPLIPEKTVTPLATRDYAFCQEQQRAHEDCFRVHFENIMCSTSSGVEETSFRYYAVFDGHGGSHNMGVDHVAHYCETNLHIRLMSCLARVDCRDKSLVAYAIRNTFVSFDTEMYNLSEKNKLKYGCTCTMILIDDTHNRLYQVNLGDSRSIIFRDETIISETQDHKPTLTREKTRIDKAGGFVAYDRVMGDLALSRAFGDFSFKLLTQSNSTFYPKSPSEIASFLEKGTSLSNFPFDVYGQSSIVKIFNPVAGMISSVPDIKCLDIVQPMTIMLTSDAPFDNPNINCQTLVSLYRVLNTRFRSSSLYDNDKKLLLEKIVIGMVETLKDKTTDDITIVVAKV